MSLNYGLLTAEDGRITDHTDEGTSFDVIKAALHDVTFGAIQCGSVTCFYDDEFLLKENPQPSFIVKNVNSTEIEDADVVICGDVLFACTDDNGSTVSLTDDAKDTIGSLVPAILGGNWIWIYPNFPTCDHNCDCCDCKED